MSMQAINGRGKLYNIDEEKLIATVNYQIRYIPQGEWSGSFTSEGEHLWVGTGGYILELQDGRKGKILISHINVRPNVTNYYEFHGSGPLT